MKKGGGGQKGGAFERLICKELSKDMTKGQRKDIFWRTSMSGGRATLLRNVHGQRDLSQAGDISATDPIGHWLTDQFLIECKHHRDCELDRYLINRGGKIAKWLKKAVKEADRTKGFLLVFKQNNMPTLVITDAPSVRKGNDHYDFANGSLLAIPNGIGGKHLVLCKFDHLIAVIKQACAGPYYSQTTTRRRPQS